ncbi:hypothetical protein ACJOMT_03955, partial [Mycoplasmopsis synoviae]
KKKHQISFISKSLKATYEEDQKAIINDVTLTNDQKTNAKKASLNFISVGFTISSTDNHLEKTYDSVVDQLEEDSKSLWINKPIYIAEGKENSIIGTKEY